MTDHIPGVDELRRLRQDVEMLEATVYGNPGQPGIPEQVRKIRADLDRLETAMKDEQVDREATMTKYVTVERFSPIERIVFWIVFLFASALIAALAAGVLKRG